MGPNSFNKDTPFINSKFRILILCLVSFTCCAILHDSNLLLLGSDFTLLIHNKFFVNAGFPRSECIF